MEKLWRHFLISKFGWFIAQGPQGHKIIPNSREKTKITQILFCFLVLWTDHASLTCMVDGKTVDFRVKFCVVDELWTWVQVCTNITFTDTHKGWTTLFSPLGKRENLQTLIKKQIWANPDSNWGHPFYLRWPNTNPLITIQTLLSTSLL